MLALDNCMCTQFWLALKQNRRHTDFDNPSNPLRLRVSDRAAVKSVRSKLEIVIETSYCISAFVRSSLDPHHCILIVFLVFPSCSPLQMPLEGYIWLMSLFVQAGILPFLYCILFPSTNTEIFLKIEKIQLHPFDLQKSQYLTIKQYIYFTIEWFSKDQQAFTVISKDM